MAKLIKITVDDSTGEFDVDLTGFHGKGCDAIIQACGELGEIKTEVKKPEYYETNNKAVRTVTAKQ
jgi:hypothetical protein